MIDDDDLRHEIDHNDDDSDMIKIMIWLKMPMKDEEIESKSSCIVQSK